MLLLGVVAVVVTVVIAILREVQVVAVLVGLEQDQIFQLHQQQLLR
jgi:homoserine acetyltransferase